MPLQWLTAERQLDARRPSVGQAFHRADGIHAVAGREFAGDFEIRRCVRRRFHEAFCRQDGVTSQNRGKLLVRKRGRNEKRKKRQRRKLAS